MSTLALQQLLQQVLLAGGVRCSASEDGVRVSMPNGLVLQPLLLASKRNPWGGIHTTTVVEVSHATLAPQPLFEYQHTSGATQQEALEDGFESWAQMDLATLIDACEPVPAHCSVMELSYERERGGDGLRRQVLLGPMAHYQERDPAGDEAHGFCPCCLFTNSLSAFEGLLRSERFLGIRLYATRDADGNCDADCRVNGHDFPAALPLLREYASGWPDAGMEFRKQYVVIRNRPVDDA